MGLDSNTVSKQGIDSEIDFYSQLVSYNNQPENNSTVWNSDQPQFNETSNTKRFRKGPPPTSCDLCKRWKVKCNRVIPTCNTCLKSGSDCTYNYASKYWEQQKKTKSSRKPPLTLTRVLPSSFYGDLVPSNSISQFLHRNFTKEFVENFATHPNIGFEIAPDQIPSEINRLLGDLDHNSPSFKHSIAKYFIKLNPNLIPILSDHVKSFSLNNRYDTAPKVEEPQAQNLGAGITQLVQMQLIGYYFKYLNAFYPLLDEDDFMNRLCRRDLDPSFNALLNIVCMIGLGYSTKSALATKLAPSLGAKVRVYLMKCYNRPSLTLVQACILLSHYCNTDEDDGVFHSNWIFLGMAQQMALQLGLNVFNSKRSTKDQLLCWRVWCILAVDDVLIEHCMGLPASLSVEFGFLSQQYVSPPTKLTDRNPSLKFLRTVMIHYRLLPFVARLRLRFSRVAQTPTLSRTESLSDEAVIEIFQDPEFIQLKDMTLALEKLYHQWYQFIPNFKTTSPTKGPRRHYLELCDPADKYTGLLLVFYFSTLIEMYRPLILPGQSLQSYHAVLDHGRISIYDFSHLNPLEKAATAAHFGVQLFRRSGLLLAELGHPYMWYCVMHMTFMHLYLLSRYPPPHPIAAPTRAHLMYLAVLTQYGSQKCALVRDLFHTMDPLLRAYRTT